MSDRSHPLVDASLQQETLTEARPGGHPMEIWISHVLRSGVVLAAVIILLGLLVYVVVGPPSGAPTSVHQILHSSETSVRPGGVFHGAIRGDSIALIQVGVLALIITPVTRVAMSIVLFSSERDGVFVLITSIVLAILVVGLIGIV
jgi:uncharacterized membrane protein